MSEKPAVRAAEAGRLVDEQLSARYLKVLERAPLFQALSRRHRGRIARLAQFVDYHNDEVIVRDGDPGDSFYVVLEGDALAVPSQGHERLLTSADSFGELSLIDGAPRAATVSAVGPVTTARIARDDFQRILHDVPALAAALLPGLTLIVRDLARLDAERIPDHGDVRDWRGGETAERPEASAVVLEGRDALGWLLLLRHVSVFETLSDRHLRHVARLVTVERFEDGSTVVLAGARGDSLHIVLDGRARVGTPSGHTRMLGVDDCFGELSLLDGAPRAATVSAIGELTTAKITRADFQKLLKSEPGMAVGLLGGLVATVRDIQRELTPM